MFVLVLGSIMVRYLYMICLRDDGMVVNRKAARDLKLSWDFVTFVQLEGIRETV